MANLLTNESQFTPDAEKLSDKVQKAIRPIIEDEALGCYPYHEIHFITMNAVDVCLSQALMHRLYPPRSEEE